MDNIKSSLRKQECDGVSTGANDSFRKDILEKDKRWEELTQKRKAIIKDSLKEYETEETNEWREKINKLYERVYWSLLYRIDRDQEALSQGIDVDSKEENIKERLALSLEMKGRLLEIYRLLRVKEESSQHNASDRERWFYNLKGLLGTSKIEAFDIDRFFETPRETKQRKRATKRENGTDFRGRVLSEIHIINDVRLHFPWQEIPVEILSNIGETVEEVFLAIIGFKRDSEGKISPR